MAYHSKLKREEELRQFLAKRLKLLMGQNEDYNQGIQDSIDLIIK